MRKRAYVETSIPSFYFEPRSEPEMAARRGWTRKWWNRAAGRYELVTSVVVVEELSAGKFPAREECLALIAHLDLLPMEPAIAEIVRAYISRKVMPRKPAGDALHLALASFHHCDFLVTWNCRHLANANKFDHIQRVNTMLGLYNPSLVTPLQLLGGEHEERG